MTSSNDRFERYFNNEFNEEEHKEFEAWLKLDPQNAKDFARESFLRAQLRRHFRSKESVKAEIKEIKRSSNQNLLYIAALIVLSLGLLYVMANSIFDREDHSSKYIAKVIGFEGVGKCNGKKLELDQLLRDGVIDLKKGELTIVFDHGTEVLFKAPAKIDLETDMLIKLLNGGLVARVTDDGYGFTVLGPDSAVIDLGTEFAVSVEGDKSWVEVYDGEVDVALLDEKGHAWKNKSLFATGPVKVDSKSGKILKEAPQKPLVKFPKIELEELNISSSYASAVLESKPLSYWRFNEKKVEKVKDEKSKSNFASRGAVETYKNALHFPNGKKGHGYAVINNLKPDFFSKEYSIELWINPSFTQDRVVLDSYIKNALNKREKKILKMSIMHNRVQPVYPGQSIRVMNELWPVGEEGVSNIYSDQKYTAGQWHHLVLVRDSEHLKFYMNGSLSSQMKVVPMNLESDSLEIALGVLILSSERGQKNHFKGLMDEVAIYDTALSESEIQKHYSFLVRS